MKTEAKVLIGLCVSDYRSDPGRLGYRATSVLTSPPALIGAGGSFRLAKASVGDLCLKQRTSTKAIRAGAAPRFAAEFPCPPAIIADVAPASSRAFQKPRGGRPRLVGNRRAGQHTGDFLAPCILFEN